MKKLLFETDLGGHRMEYIHHIYMGMGEHRKDDFVIAVPQEFEDKKALYEWPEFENVRFVYIEGLRPLSTESGFIRQSFYLSKMLRRYVKKVEADSVFLITLMGFIPGLLFYISSRVHVSGIIYKHYLYSWKKSSRIKKTLEVAKYLVMRYCSCLTTVFILNDTTVAAKLNKLYHTDKFQFLTDPFNAIDYQPQNIRKELQVGDGDKMFFHFGGLNRRKGTIDILESIKLLPQEELKRCVFVFAGKVYSAIRKEFYDILQTLPSEARVRVYDEFCTNEFIADCCTSSDFILIPYYATGQSSGLIGYAAYYGTPVIGPAEGLVGKLIRKYRLGITISEITPANIAQSVSDAKTFRVDSRYKDIIRVEHFNEEIFSYF